ASKFFLSLEDDLMRIFGSERMDLMLRKLGLQEGEAIVHSWINKALEKAQQKVEARNFEIRKNLLKYDNVMNDQRKVIYEQRREIMSAEDVAQTITEMREEILNDLVTRCIPENAFVEQWDVKTLHDEAARLFNLDLPIEAWSQEEGIADEAIRERLHDALDRKMAEKAANYGPQIMRMAEKSLLLQLLDQAWKEHLLALDHLRQGIGLRAYGQRDPLNEYKREAFELFSEMLARLRESVTSVLANLELRIQTPEDELFARREVATQEIREDPAFAEAEAPASGGDVALMTRPRRRAAAPVVDPRAPETWGKVARNAPCPCGSGKKYKHCHGAQ
ncbi:MAG: SEC-C domain-containing protein, partial [Proteobacteria bacterium]|nr:SEC-C domain-containing protein [Pseudomonadota bacterium]